MSALKPDDEIETQSDDEEKLHETLDVVFKPTDQIKFENLMIRLSLICLLCSAMLFIGQTVAVSTTSHDFSSVISGYIFSLFLFLSWFSIHRIYNKNEDQQALFLIRPLTLNFRIRSQQEMNLMVPNNWLWIIASQYFVSSLFISSGEIYLMADGIKSYYSDLGPIHGVRIGLAIIFCSTGITCLCLIKRQQKKTATISALILAIISLIAASFLSSFWYLRADMRLLSTMGNPEYDQIKHRVLSHMSINSDGFLFFFILHIKEPSLVGTGVI